EYDLTVAAADIDEIEEVNANCILMANLQQASTSVVSQDKMTIVKKESVVDTSDLQTELKRTKERFENYIIKKKNEYAKLWNDLYKKCGECKYDKISYDKAYKDMQQNIKRFQAQLGDLKGKSKDTSCVSDTRNPLSPKLENENVELEFQVSDQKDNTHDMSENTKFAKQPIMENLPKLVQALGQNRSLFHKTPVFTKKDVNSDLHGLSSTRVDNTKSRRPQPRSNIKHDKVPSASKSSRSKNKEAEVEEH
nr:hypothetical protein [Tanacetum cinerariifolium]